MITSSAEITFLDNTLECMEDDDDQLIKYLIDLQRYDEALRLASLPGSHSINQTMVVRTMMMNYLERKHNDDMNDDAMELEFEDADFGF